MQGQEPEQTAAQKERTLGSGMLVTGIMRSAGSYMST